MKSNFGKTIGLKSCLFLAAAAVLAAQPNTGAPRYVAAELSLDGAMRDAAAGENQLVGSLRTPAGETHAVVRRKDGLIDLHPAGAAASRAIAGNTDVQVGSADIGSHSHAMVWQAAGDALDLHQFLPTGFSASAATGIDAAGNITGVAIDSLGAAHDILWRANVQAASASGGSGGGNSGGGGGSTGGGGVTVTADKITITRALWFYNAMAPPTGDLLIQATSSRKDVVLTLTDTVTGQFIATLPNLGGGQYGGSVIFRFNPSTSVTVTSNLGGAATRNVILGTP